MFLPKSGVLEVDEGDSSRTEGATDKGTYYTKQVQKEKHNVKGVPPFKQGMEIEGPSKYGNSRNKCKGPYVDMCRGPLFGCKGYETKHTAAEGFAKAVFR